MERKIGIRFGLVPLTKTSESISQAKVFYYLKNSYGLGAALNYLDGLLATNAVSKPSSQVFTSILKDATIRKDRPVLSLDEVVGAVDIEEWTKKAEKWGARLAVNSPVPPIFINGLYLPRDEGWMQGMSARLQADVQVTQRAVYEELVNDNSDLAELLLMGAVARRNAYIIPEDETKVVLVNTVELVNEYADVFQHLPKVHTDRPTKLSRTTIWVIGDFDEKDGCQLLQGAAGLQKDSSGVDLVLVNNPEVMAGTASLSTLLYQLQQVDFFSVPERFQQLLEEVKLEQAHIELPKIEMLMGRSQPDVKSASWSYPDHIEAGRFWESARGLAQKAGFKPGQRGLVVNGRVIGPIPISDAFDAEDFKQLLDYEWSRRIVPVLTAADALGVLERLDGKSAELTNLVALTSASEAPNGLFDTPALARTDAFFELWKGEHTTIENGSRDSATFQVVASVDPASEMAQKVVPILKVLSEMDGVYLRVYLNPQRMVGELPVKRFYRHVLNSAPKFDDAGYVLTPFIWALNN